MIDDIIDNNPNSALKNSFVNALGIANGTTVVQDILKNNPQFTEETKRIEVFDAVAAECLKQQMYGSSPVQLLLQAKLCIVTSIRTII